MSVHGICFDNGQAGRCNYECEQFLVGRCDIGVEIVEMMYKDMTQEEVTAELQYNFEEVKLFLMQGTGVSDLKLLIEAFGY